MIRGQWDVAGPGAGEGGGDLCTRHPSPALAAPTLPQRTGLRTRESRKAAHRLPLGSLSTPFPPGGIPRTSPNEGLRGMTIIK